MQRLSKDLQLVHQLVIVCAKLISAVVLPIIFDHSLRVTFFPIFSGNFNI